jgi:hypothetical protein
MDHHQRCSKELGLPPSPVSWLPEFQNPDSPSNAIDLPSPRSARGRDHRVASDVNKPAQLRRFPRRRRCCCWENSPASSSPSPLEHIPAP